MKLIAIVSVICMTSSAALAQTANADSDVRAPLEAYLRGQSTGNESEFRRAFHPDAELFGVRNGALTRSTAEEFIARVSRPAGTTATATSAFSGSIEQIDVDGDVATAKIVIARPNARVVDLMSLMKLDGRWVIVNKTFAIQPPAATD